MEHQSSLIVCAVLDTGFVVKLEDRQSSLPIDSFRNELIEELLTDKLCFNERLQAAATAGRNKGKFKAFTVLSNDEYIDRMNSYYVGLPKEEITEHEFRSLYDSLDIISESTTGVVGSKNNLPGNTGLNVGMNFIFEDGKFYKKNVCLANTQDWIV